MSNSPSRRLRESPFSVADDSQVDNLAKDEVDEGASQYATPALSLVGSFNGRTLPVDVRLDEAALLAAAESGDAEAIQSMLADAKLDAAGERGSQALVNAAKKGHTEVVRVLLEAGASVYASDRDGRPALAVAAKKGHTEVVCVLLEAGASVRAEDMTGRQALHWAAMKGWAEVAKTLLDAGASPNCEDVGGYMPLHYAAYGGEFGTVRMRWQSVSDMRKACQPPSQGHLQVMQVLVETGADVNKPCDSHGMPLHIAAAKGVQQVSLLLAAGADPRAIHNSCATPLHCAAMAYQPDIVAVLLKAGACPRAGARVGATPLFAAMAQLGLLNDLRTCVLEMARELEGQEDDSDFDFEIEFEGEQDWDEGADWEQDVTRAVEVARRLKAAGDPAAKVLKTGGSKEGASDPGKMGLELQGVPMDLGLAKDGFKVVQEALAAGPGKKLLSCTIS